MTNTNSQEVINFNIEKAISILNDKHKAWRAHVESGENILYSLLEECLDFHNFLVRESDYQSAFKGMCRFSWHKNTGLTTLIAKTVFGVKNKQTYTYIKALDTALAKGVGADGAISMEQWLKENGGVSGVIRGDGGNSKAEIERAYRIRIAQEAERFGFKDKYGAFVSKELVQEIEHGSSDVVLLAKVDRSTGEFTVKWLSEEHAIRNKLWEVRGESMMMTEAYRRNKDAYIQSIREKDADVAAKICEAFSKITSLKKIEQGAGAISKVCVEA